MASGGLWSAGSPRSASLIVVARESVTRRMLRTVCSTRGTGLTGRQCGLRRDGLQLYKEEWEALRVPLLAPGYYARNPLAVRARPALVAGDAAGPLLLSAPEPLRQVGLAD